MQPTVLVVDDHTDSRNICEIILSRHGYRVLSAAEGRTGLAIATTELPDVILLDIALPGLDGWEVAQALQGEPATNRIPIILYTAYWLESDRARARAMGCAGYLTKPCSPQSILAEVDRVLTSRAVPETPLTQPR